MTQPHESKRIITRHTRLYHLCCAVYAHPNGYHANRVSEITFFQNASDKDIRTVINAAANAGVIYIVTPIAAAIDAVKPGDNLSTIRLVLTSIGQEELAQVHAQQAKGTPMQQLAATRVHRTALPGTQNPLNRPPKLRDGAEDHAQHPSRHGDQLTTYHPHP